MSAVEDSLLAVARSFLGEVENPPFSNLHPTVEWYRKHIEDIGLRWPYCAAGVTREYENSLAKGLYRPRAYVPWSMQDFQSGYADGRLMWIDTEGQLMTYAKPGRVAFFDWSGRKTHNTWDFDHVGIIESVNLSRREVITIEHNTTMPGGGNEGTTRRVRDAKYLSALGVPNFKSVELPTIGGLPLLKVDGAWGPKTQLALETIMAELGYRVSVKGDPVGQMNRYFIESVQESLNEAGWRCRHGRKLAVDGVGLGYNDGKRYPRSGSMHTIEAMQIGHGVKPSRADGMFDKDESAEVKRIQRDANYGGVRDNPFFHKRNN